MVADIKEVNVWQIFLDLIFQDLFYLHMILQQMYMLNAIRESI